jgi:hypothetical protein
MDPLNRELEPCYLLIVETASEGVWLGDCMGRTTLGNAQIRQMLGFVRADMDPQADVILLLTLPRAAIGFMVDEGCSRFDRATRSAPQ